MVAPSTAGRPVTPGCPRNTRPVRETRGTLLRPVVFGDWPGDPSPGRERCAWRACSCRSEPGRKVRARWPDRTLVTAPSSDRPGRPVPLCHGRRSLSSRISPGELRRRGRAPPPADLPRVRPSFRRLRVVRPRPCLLLSLLPHGRPPALGPRRPGAPPAQPRRPSRPPRPPARVPRAAAPRDGSHFPPAAATRQTTGPERSGSFPAYNRALRGLRPASGADRGASRRSETLRTPGSGAGAAAAAGTSRHSRPHTAPAVTRTAPPRDRCAAW